MSKEQQLQNQIDFAYRQMAYYYQNCDIYDEYVEEAIHSENLLINDLERELELIRINK